MSAVLAECRRRGYDQSQTLAVLTAALEAITVDLDALDSIPHPTVDPWYNIAATQGINPNQWQAFKNRLYFHIRTAGALYEGKDDFLSALSDDEQRELFENVKEIRAQLGPRAHASWPSLGLNDEGEELTLRDAFGVMKTDVAAIKDNL